MKRTKSLVSVITPCYNGEKHIFRLLDSLLSQDYPEIEMIVVDDGSTDNSRDIIESYIDRFVRKGYSLQCVYQKNAGQAAAINKALSLVKGEYLLWPDADDYYVCDTAITEMVKAFESLDDSYGIVRCEEVFVKEEDLSQVGVQKYQTHKECIFEEYFTAKESVALTGSHMIRMKLFDEVNPQRHIFDGRAPQNFQMILPISYSYKIFTIQRELFARLIRMNSHSRSLGTYEKHLDDFEGFKEILDNTFFSIKAITDTDRQRSLRLSHIYSLTGKLFYALKFGKAKDANRFAKELKGLGVKQTKAGLVRLRLVYIPFLLKIFDSIINRLR